MKRLLIFNADDYGLSPGVCGGIRRAAEGVVRSTTVLPDLVSAEDLDALRLARIGAGVHLNLSVGFPLTGSLPAEMLKPDGSFSRDFAVNPASWASVQLDPVRAEWRAQIESLVSAGCDLTHLDSHHHLHLFEPLFPVALELAREYKLAMRTRAGQSSAARSAGVPTTDCLIEGFFGWRNITKGVLLVLLDQAEGDAVEVMCHPGLVDDQLKDRSGYLGERSAELAVLGDPSLALELERRGWALGGFSQLTGSSTTESV